MDNKLISVIIPAYNAEKTIERCINSITTGGYRFIEVVIVNDGSTDNTLNIVQQLAKKDSRIILINKENGGVSSAKNAGLRICSGDYVAWCDSDDYYDEDFLSFLYEKIKETEADIVRIEAKLNGEIKGEDNNQYYVFDRNQALSALIEHKLINGSLCVNLFKRECFDNIIFDERLKIFEDLDVMWQVLKKVHKVVRYNVRKYNYMDNDESLTRKSVSNDRLSATFFVWDKILNECISKPEFNYLIENVKAIRVGWIYGSLKLMYRFDFYDLNFERRIQKELRDNYNLLMKKTKSAKDRFFISLCCVNLRISRLLYKKIIR